MNTQDMHPDAAPLLCPVCLGERLDGRGHGEGLCGPYPPVATTENVVTDPERAPAQTPHERVFVEEQEPSIGGLPVMGLKQKWLTGDPEKDEVSAWRDLARDLIARAEAQKDFVDPRFDVFAGYAVARLRGQLGLPDSDYSCGAAYCDDPACNTHGKAGREPEPPDQCSCPVSDGPLNPGDPGHVTGCPLRETT